MIIKKYRLLRFFAANSQGEINGKTLLKTGLIICLACVGIMYMVMATSLHYNQEALIFRSNRLSKNHKFKFPGIFEEHFFRMPDSVMLHGLLFKVPESKGLIFYLHGNLGALDTWGDIAPTYNYMGYDIFMLDYRGYGKSQGVIQNEQQLYRDISLVYHKLLEQYPERKVIIAGHSLGSAPATWLASHNSPKAVFLLRPYYDLVEYGSSRFPFLPKKMHRYTLETNKYIKDINVPLYIFHDNKRSAVSYQNSIKLQKIMKFPEQFHTVTWQRNQIDRNSQYFAHLEVLLGSEGIPGYLSDNVK